jgi:hypothetical protein
MANFSPVAALVATFVIFFFSFLWFNGKTFFPIWWKAMGKSGDPAAGGHSMGVTFGSTFIATLTQGFVLAWVLAKLTPADGLTAIQGFTYAFVLGLGFAAATSLGHRLFGQQGFKVWAIEVGADVLGLALAGAVISLWY